MRKLGIIALVAIGILACLQGLSLFAVTFQVTVMGGDSGVPWWANVAAYLTPALGAILVGALLITYRGSLADRWFEDGEVSTSIDATSLVRVLLVTVGVWMVAFGIPAVLGSVLFGLTSVLQGLAQDTGPTLFDALPRALPEALEIVIGVFLVVRSESLARRLWVGRTVAVEPEAQELPVCPSCGAQYDPEDYRDAASAICTRCKEPLPLPRA